jgi:hypothetical protein
LIEVEAVLLGDIDVVLEGKFAKVLVLEVVVAVVAFDTGVLEQGT